MISTEKIINLIIPQEILKSFEVIDLEEQVGATVIILHEKQTLVPLALSGKTAVLDGFCNPIELLHFPLNFKKLYLKLYRRRWKEKGQNKHYSNEYEFHLMGMKATKSFGAFLKESL